MYQNGNHPSYRPAKANTNLERKLLLLPPHGPKPNTHFPQPELCQNPNHGRGRGRRLTLLFLVTHIIFSLFFFLLFICFSFLSFLPTQNKIYSFVLSILGSPTTAKPLCKIQSRSLSHRRNSVHSVWLFCPYSSSSVFTFSLFQHVLGCVFSQ